jgi:hypothetical protein
MRHLSSRNKYSQVTIKVCPVEEEKFAGITPHRLAALSLCRAADGLAQVDADSTVWFFVILDLHRALYSALIDALSGSAGIGAYSSKLQAEWSNWFEASRTDPDLPPPVGNFVMHFDDLLARAEQGDLKLLTPQQREDIVNLNQLRDNLEHVKPETWYLKIAGLPRICASAAAAFAVLLESFHYHLDENELERTKTAIATLSGPAGVAQEHVRRSGP